MAVLWTRARSAKFYANRNLIMNNMKKNRLQKILKSDKLLSIYTTAGYPSLEESFEVLQNLAIYGVDFVELGMPYSDPLADGKTIQMSSDVAIRNGMTMVKYFELAKRISKTIDLPVVYMGYLNQIMQVGIEEFCKKCVDTKIDCVIIPDLPPETYIDEFKSVFEKYGLLISFLITPTTSEERIRKIEKLTMGFIYVVSSNAVTGKKGELDGEQIKYLRYIKSLQLSKPTIVGFGIHDKNTFETACEYANGAIIGSEFIRRIGDNSYREFLKSLK